MDSNGDVPILPGFEDLDDELIVKDDIAQSNLREDVDEKEREIAN